MLELTALAKAYDGFEFGPVDLGVDEEVLAVLGPSGSGKTTLLSLIAGLVRPDSGSVSLDGRSLDGVPIESRETGLVFQDGALFPHLTAQENVAYAASDPTRIDELASLLEIGDVLDRRPPTLSGGEKQRVALARTLAADPEALLLDEPLSSLDAPIRRRLRGELRSLFESLDIPVIYVTHEQRTATALGDRVAIVRDGRIEQIGAPATVLKRPATRFVAEFTGNENVFDATVAARSGDSVELDVGGARIRATDDTVPRDRSVGSTATVCIHPSYLRLGAPSEATETPGETNEAPGDATRSATETTLNGGVKHWLHEGDEYRVTVDVGTAADGSERGPIRLTVTVRPPTFERLGIRDGTDVRVGVPPAAIHVIE